VSKQEKTLEEARVFLEVVYKNEKGIISDDHLDWGVK
jgi:hypothetical protein